MVFQRKTLFVVFLLTFIFGSEASRDEVYRFHVPQGPGMHASRETIFDFLVAGQSNAANVVAERDKPMASTTGQVFLNRYDKPTDSFDLSGTYYVPTLIDPIGASLAWVHFGDMLFKKFGKPIHIFNIASAGTSSRQWRDHLYRRMIDALKGPAKNAKAVLWVQGETDWDQRMDAQETVDNTIFIIKESLKIKPDLIWYLGPTTAAHKNVDIRVAQFELIRKGWALMGPDYDEMRNNPDWVEVGATHFTGNGHRAIAQFWFDILNNRPSK